MEHCAHVCRRISLDKIPLMMGLFVTHIRRPDLLLAFMANVHEALCLINSHVCRRRSLHK